MFRQLPRSTPPGPAGLMAAQFQRQFFGGRGLPVPEAVLGRLLQTEKIDRLLAEAVQSPHATYYEKVLASLEVGYTVAPDALERIPKTGPVVVVANHPFGMVEGAVLGAMITRVRLDVKFLANSLLRVVPELREHIIAVNPFGGDDATRANTGGMRESLLWLREGHVLAVFPAGEVSTWNLRKFAVADPEWNDIVGRIILRTSAHAVPVFIEGHNGAWFHVAGMVHPRLRTALLPRELLNKRRKNIALQVGKPIPPERLARFQTAVEVTEYLRNRTYLLQARRGNTRKFPWPQPPKARIRPAVDPSVLAAEVAGLPAPCLLASGGGLSAYIARASQIPNLLCEIGRLRETTFRAAGEGTGKPADLDAFDTSYHHLFLWSPERREIVGAYRLTGTDEVPKSLGLYTSTLFRFQPGFLEKIHPALELGRSFVRAECQRSYGPLLMLWKGIGEFLVRNPRYRVLFGPVSISRDYTAASRELMVSYLGTHCCRRDLAGAVKARHPFRARPLAGRDIQHLSSLVSDLEELSEVVADAEPDSKGLPILIRQYLNLGGELLQFNVDGKFSNVVDGLIVVDLDKTDPKLLARYLGKSGAESFLRFRSGSPVAAR